MQDQRFLATCVVIFSFFHYQENLLWLEFVGQCHTFKRALAVWPWS